jgi:alpha-1,2-mannosyltransferase
VIATSRTIFSYAGTRSTDTGKSSIARGSTATAQEGGRCPDRALLVCISPCFLWLGAISALPHKEERFLYIVYPLLCLGAAASLDICFRAARKVLGSRISRAMMVVLLLSMSALSFSRSMALVLHYGAPIPVYRSLPEEDSNARSIHGSTNVCVGAEWYRFPSSFFLPGRRYRLRFLKSSFDGLLPKEFDESGGGTRASPPELNQWNREEPANYWNDTNRCHYVVTMSTSPSENCWWLDGDILGDPAQWQVMREERFLNAAESPSLTRAFYIPFITSKRNSWSSYVLLKRRNKT